MMNYSTLQVHEFSNSVAIILNRKENKNALNQLMLQELHHCLDNIENNTQIRTVILEGSSEFFCVGMDLYEMAQIMGDETKIRSWATAFFSLCMRLIQSSKVIISKVEGKVMGGGLGLVAAADYVIATPTATFRLPEIFWGLIPIMVTPFLIRRIGYQSTYRMGLLGAEVSVDEAKQTGLVDDVTKSPQTDLNKLLSHLEHSEPWAVKQFKAHYQQFFSIDEELKITSVDAITHLLLNPKTQEKINNFVKNQQLPWK